MSAIYKYIEMSSKFDYGAYVIKFRLRRTKGYRILWKKSRKSLEVVSFCWKCLELHGNPRYWILDLG